MIRFIARITTVSPSTKGEKKKDMFIYSSFVEDLYMLNNDSNSTDFVAMEFEVLSLQYKQVRNFT